MVFFPLLSICLTFSFHYMASLCSLLRYPLWTLTFPRTILVILAHSLDYRYAVPCVALQVDLTNKVPCQAHSEIHGSGLLPT